MPRKAKHSITVYALRDTVKRPADAVRDREGIKYQSIQIGKTTGYLYIVPAKNNKPRWARILEGKVDLEEFGIHASGAYGVLLIKTKRRMFALTFGSGRHLLHNDVIEERFGLKATLNAIEPTSIRSLDRKSFEALSRQVHEQATRPATVPDFGLDVEQDMLRAVVGTPRDPALAARLHGKDSLVAVIDHGLERITELLEKCDALSRDDSYKKDYSCEVTGTTSPLCSSKALVPSPGSASAEIGPFERRHHAVTPNPGSAGEAATAPHEWHAG